MTTIISGGPEGQPADTLDEVGEAAGPAASAPARGHRLRAPNRWAAAGLLALVFVTLAFLLPMLVVVLKSLNDPSPAAYSQAVHWVLFWPSVKATFEMAVITTVLCLVVAYPYAYVMARGGRVIRAVLGLGLLISFWTSLLVRTFAWQVLLANNGPINKALESLGLIHQPITMLNTTFAADLAMVHINAPFLVLALYAQMRTISPDLEMAAQSMGARPSVAFWRVTVPLSLPGALAGSVLVFVMALGFYITPEILGPNGSFYLGQAIVLQIDTFLNTGVGAAISVMLLVVVIALLAVAARLIGLKSMLATASGAQR